MGVVPLIADGLLLGALLLAWGAQAVIPWRLAAMEAERRRAWALALLPLLLTGVVAALLYLRHHLQAAVFQRLFPLAASRPGRALALLLLAMTVADLLLAIGWRRLEATGWRIAAGLGLLFLLAATWAAELVRTGEGPASTPGVLPLLVILRALVALGAAEALAPGRPFLAVAGASGLAFYSLLLPAPLAQALGSRGQWITVVTAALLMAMARRVPLSLRRPALLGAALLAGLYLAQAASLSERLGAPPPLTPDLRGRTPSTAASPPR
jgi:hypothetical protein